MATYVFDNAWQQRQRLAGLEAAFDPGTIRHLEARGVREGWRCLEVGAGGGSIAEWLCRRVGPRGRVVATDLDTRFLMAIDQPNLEVRRHDIAADDLPEGAFDLVHVRLVLLHLPQREQVLQRLEAALKPGGWLVVEEADFGSWVCDPGVGAEATALFQTMGDAHNQALAARGVDPFYGRRLFGHLRAQGLGEVGAEGRVLMVTGGGPVSQLVGRLTFLQLREALLASALATPQEVDALLALFDNPDFVYMAPLIMAAWGRRGAT